MKETRMKPMHLILTLMFCVSAQADIQVCGGQLSLNQTAIDLLLHPSVYERNYYRNRFEPPLPNSASTDTHWLRQGLGQGDRGSLHFISDEYLKNYSTLMSPDGNICKSRIQAARHFSQFGRQRGWSGFSNITPLEWRTELTTPSMRISSVPADPALDTVVSMADAIDPSHANRIKIVIQKPRIAPNVPLTTFSSLAAMIDHLKAHPQLQGARLKLTRGNYVLSPQTGNCTSPTSHLCLTGFQDLDIDFGGSTITFEDQYTMGVSIASGSQRLVVRNLSLSWNYKNYFRAKLVRGMHQGLSRAKLVQIASGEYPGALPPAEFDAIVPFNFSTNSYFLPGRYSARVNYTTAFPEPVANLEQTFYSSSLELHPDFHTGDDVLVLRNRRGPVVNRSRAQAILISGRTTSDITLDNVSIRKAPQSAIVVNAAGRGLHFKNCKIRRLPEEAISTRGGGIIVWGSEGDILIEGTQNPRACNAPPCLDRSRADYSEFIHLGDDAMNIFPMGVVPRRTERIGSNLRVLVDSNTPAIAATANSPARLNQIKVGDRFAFITRRQHPVGFGTVTNLQFVLPTQLWIELTTNNREALYEELSKPSPAEILAVNLSVSSSRLLVRNVSMGTNDARGVLVSSPNAVISGNVVDRTAAGGIVVRYQHSSFFEGSPVNIVIQDNNIYRASNRLDHTYAPGAIAIYSEGLNPEAASSQSENVGRIGEDAYGYFPIVQQVLVQRNWIQSIQGSGISVVAASGVNVLANFLSDVGTLGMSRVAAPRLLSPSGSLFFAFLKDYQVLQNRCSRFGQSCVGSQGIIQDSESTFNGNLQPSLPR